MQLPWPYPDVDAAAEQYLRAAVGRVDEWLAARADHFTTADYLALLRPLFEAGGTDVRAVDVEEWPEGGAGRASMIHRMVVRLPADPEVRGRVVEAAREVQRRFDVTHEADIGERYAILETALLRYWDLL